MILVTIKSNLLLILQAFIKTAAKILQNIQDGVFDVSNEVIYLQLVPCIKMCEITSDDRIGHMPRLYDTWFIHKIIFFKIHVVGYLFKMKKQ